MAAMPAFRSGPVTVRVPATSANLGPGFDTLGLALDLEDEVTAELSDEFRVYVEGEGAGEVPEGREHLIVATLLTTYREMGIEPPDGLRLSCVNRIPHARGLGSSSGWPIPSGSRGRGSRAGGRTSWPAAPPRSWRRAAASPG